MKAADSNVSFKDTVEKWQKKATERRENDAQRAGVAFSTDPVPEYKRRGTESKDDIRASDARDSLAKKRGSQRATRVSHPTAEVDLNYHEPIKVRFGSSVDTRDPKTPTHKTHKPN